MSAPVPPPGKTGIEVFTTDEVQALIWAARRGVAELRAQGWKDMARNADILDSARQKLEAP